MAKEDLPPNISRRQVLASAAAAATATGAVRHLPAVGAAEVADSAQAMSAAADGPALNLSAGMARRLLEIARRDKIRREAGLPLLSAIKELKRMKQAEREREFARFEAAHGDAVLEEVLRQARRDPNWRPNWMQGIALQSRARRILLEQFNQARLAASARTRTDLTVTS